MTSNGAAAKSNGAGRVEGVSCGVIIRYGKSNKTANKAVYFWPFRCLQRCRMNSSRLFVVGLNHLNAPVAARERATVAWGALVGELAALKERAGLDEVTVLSTCSRVDVFAACSDPARGQRLVREWFASRAGEAVAPLLYAREAEAALTHLFRVAAGLDSWIVGETEILAQVKKAYQAALGAGFTRRVLNRAFQSAIAAGKDVRTATGIQNGVHSIGGATALMAKRIFGDAPGGSIVVFGAGQTAEAVVRHLAAKKFDRVVVANRTPENARALAETLGGEPVSLEEGLAALAEAKVAVFSTSAPAPLLSRELLDRACARRREPLFLVDLGVPRNVAPDCAGRESVYLYDLDDLKRMLLERQEGKLAAKVRAEALTASAARDCLTELDKAVSPPAANSLQSVRLTPTP